MAKIIDKPTAPRPEHVAYWVDKGWRHKGLGVFVDRSGHRGRLHVYSDGSTGIRIINFCAIRDGLKGDR